MRSIPAARQWGRVSPAQARRMATLRGLLAALASAAASQALELHVSDRAGRLGAGTRQRAFPTLHEARDAMRAGLGANEPRTVRV